MCEPEQNINMTTVIASVGYPGAGKSTISDWMRKRNIPVVSMGDILRNRFDQADVDKLKQELDCNNKSSLLGKWATNQRDKYGKDIVANWTCEYIENNVNSDIVFVDGLRSKEELCVFTNKFETVEIIYIKAKSEKRLKRIQERSRDGEFSFTKKELRERDEREKKWGVKQLVDEADYIVKNNGAIDEFYQKIESIFCTITS